MVTGIMGNYEYIEDASMGDSNYINYTLRADVDRGQINEDSLRGEIANLLGVDDSTVVTEDSEALLFILVAPLPKN